MKWRTLSTKKIFSHARIELLEDEVQLPHGVKTNYLRFGNINDAVTIICIREDEMFLAQREYAHPIGKKIWQFPGGSINKNEPIKKAADRELQEESNLKADSYQLIGSYLLDSRRSKAVMNVVLARGCKKVKGLPADQEEDIENHWLSETQLIDKMRTDDTNSHMLAAWTIFKAITV